MLNPTGSDSNSSQPPNHPAGPSDRSAQDQDGSSLQGQDTNIEGDPSAARGGGSNRGSGVRRGRSDRRERANHRGRDGQEGRGRGGPILPARGYEYSHESYPNSSPRFLGRSTRFIASQERRERRERLRRSYTNRQPLVPGSSMNAPPQMPHVPPWARQFEVNPYAHQMPPGPAFNQLLQGPHPPIQWLPGFFGGNSQTATLEGQGPAPQNRERVEPPWSNLEGGFDTTYDILRHWELRPTPGSSADSLPEANYGTAEPPNQPNMQSTTRMPSSHQQDHASVDMTTSGNNRRRYLSVNFVPQGAPPYDIVGFTLNDMGNLRFVNYEPSGDRSRRNVSPGFQPAVAPNFASLDPDGCTICYEDFDGDEHIAVRLGGVNGCNHIFGLPCLETWINHPTQNAQDAHICPMCRRRYIQSINDGPGLYRRSRPAAVEAVVNRLRAASRSSRTRYLTHLQRLQTRLIETGLYYPENAISSADYEQELALESEMGLDVFSRTESGMAEVFTAIIETREERLLNFAIEESLRMEIDRQNSQRYNDSESRGSG